MKCKYSGNDVALHVEGDLSSTKAREFEDHLRACDACRDLEADLRQSQILFKGLRQDTVNNAALAHVRTRILAEVGGLSARPRWGRWVYAIAGATFAAAMSVGVAVYFRTPPDVLQVVNKVPLPPAPDLSLRRVETAKIEAPALANAPKIKEAVVRAARGDGRNRQRVKQVNAVRATEPVEPPTQIVVKLLTDDPNIVIYWLVDQKNGGTL